MTRIDGSYRTCAVCGTSSNFTVLMSTIAFGYPDLDGRPPEMKRSKMDLWLQDCQHCGYINWNITELLPNAQAIVNSQEYKSILGNEEYPPLARLFLCHALFYPDDPLQAGRQILCAAWVCDDKGNQELAREFRNQAADRLLTLQPFTSGGTGDINTGMLVVDILRRAGRITEAMNVANDLLATPTVQINENAIKILNYQIQLCRKQDTSRYTIGDALRGFDTGT